MWFQYLFEMNFADPMWLNIIRGINAVILFTSLVTLAENVIWFIDHKRNPRHIKKQLNRN